MKMLDVLVSANRNLSRSKLRTFLTISAIFVGAFTLTLTTALGAGAQDYLNRQLGNVSAPGVFYVTTKTGDSPFASDSGPKQYDPKKQERASGRTVSTLSQSDVAALKKVSGVEFAKPYYSLTGEYVVHGDGTKYQSPALVQYGGLSLDLAAGRLLTSNDTNSLILPETFVSSLGFADPQAAVGQTVQVGYKDLAQHIAVRTFTVVGVMKKTFVTNGNMYVDDESANAIATAQGQDEQFFAAIVKFKDPNVDETTLKKRITDTGNYSAVSLKEQIGTLTSIISAVTSGLNVVGGIALFAASFGIINTLLMSVYERTQEIGLMKALGMHRRAVFSLFAFEAVLVGFWGSLLASLAGWAVAQGVDRWASTSFLKDFEGFTLLVVTPLNAVLVIALIMVIAFLAGTLPAIKASRLNPIEALRSE